MVELVETKAYSRSFFYNLSPSTGSGTVLRQAQEPFLDRLRNLFSIALGTSRQNQDEALSFLTVPNRPMTMAPNSDTKPPVTEIICGISDKNSQAKNNVNMGIE